MKEVRSNNKRPVRLARKRAEPKTEIKEKKKKNSSTKSPFKHHILLAFVTSKENYLTHLKEPKRVEENSFQVKIQLSDSQK